MSLSSRITLAITLLVLTTAGLAGFLTLQFAFRPFADDVLATFVHEAVYISEEVEQGARIRRLERGLGVDIRPHRGPIPRDWRVRRLRNRRVWVSPKGRKTLIVDGPRRLRIDRALDLDRPRRRIPLLFLLGSLLVLFTAAFISRRTISALSDTTDAIRRVAGGDLDHRLPETGPAEVVEVARSFNLMTERLASLIRAERERLAGISHELRTPLTRLTLELALLEDAGVPPSRLNAMQEDVDELSQLLDEALEVSRMHLGATELTREPVDLCAVARDLLDELGLEGSVEGNVVASVDRRLFTRALSNLLRNVARHAPDSSARVALAPGCLTVRDEGPGVPASAVADLFEPFSRTTDATMGLGLGLMIVRQVAELHGGTVRARNLDPGLEIELTWATATS